jgi:hypothetical protein
LTKRYLNPAGHREMKRAVTGMTPVTRHPSFTMLEILRAA